MQSSNQLQDMLRSINRKSYPAYKSLKGAYQFKKYVLSIEFWLILYESTFLPNIPCFF